MNELLTGAIVMATLTASLFFLRFWYSTRDRFFLFFALAFAIDGVDRLLLSPTSLATEDAPEYYLIRLLAYGLILYAIWDKNRPRGNQK